MNVKPILRIPTLVICAVASSICLAIGLISSTSEQPESDHGDQINDLGCFLAREYQVKISLKFRPELGESDHAPIVAEQARPAECETILRLLKSEFARYPPGFIRRTVLERIVICKNLTQSGQDKGAISDFSHRALYLNFDPDEETEESKRLDIHHEIFHMIDARDGRFEDETWASLNLPTFRYGGGHGRKQIDVPGFLTGYSTADAVEDKAELFSYMMMALDTVQDRAKTDAVIRRKLAAMKAFLANDCPEMDESFWVRGRCRSEVTAMNPF